MGENYMQNYENFTIAPEDNQNDRTKAFSVEKKIRKPDSILWIVAGLIFFFLNVISLARITIVGQFLDDVLFTLPFGWFKYFLYLLFFIINFAIYFGVKFKPKKRFVAMIFITWIMLCWIISSIMLIVIHYTDAGERTVPIFSGTIFSDTVSWFWENWLDSSVFNWRTSHWLIAPSDSYLTPFAGGGMIGAILAGLSAYLSIFGGLILACFCLFINLVWIFTGDPFYLFKSKAKRKPKRLRILSLKSKKTLINQIYVEEQNTKKGKKKKKRFSSFFSSMNLDQASQFESEQIIQSVKDSDMTIELPSFVKAVKKDNFYSEKNQSFYDEEFKTPIYEDKSIEDVNLIPEVQKNYNVGYRDYINIDKQERNYFEDDQEKYSNDYSSPPFTNQNPHLFIPKRMQNKQNEATDFYDKKSYTQTLNSQHSVGEEYFGDNIVNENKSREEAQRQFDLESNLTPYGANGRTVEMVNDIKSFKTARQITIDQMIEVTENEKNIREQKQKKLDELINPIENIYARTISNQSNNFQPVNNNQKVVINQKNSLEKEIYINRGYILPSNNLLEDVKIDSKVVNEANETANQKARKINDVFVQFGVSAKVSHINVGPSVTKFEVLPEPGTKVNSIISLENDLKFALASRNVIIEAPIQGKAAIGIEIPNEKPSVVSLKSVLEKIPYNKMNSKLFFAVGKNVLGEMLFSELDKAPHLLVAGSTGSGKSVMINAIICSILMRAKPHEVKFLMIDPKKVELSIYSSIPHLLAPVISDMSQANSALKKVVNEMERRYVLFEKAGVKKIEIYNSKTSDLKKRLPYYVVIIDELADLMMTGNKKDVEDSIMRLTQMARAAGIHLIVATQRPSTDVITGVIKTNIPTRISFAVASAIDSRTILDSGGAERLNGRGDLLYLTPGANSLVRAQGAYISDEEINILVSYISNQQEQIFDDDFMKYDVENANSINGASQDTMFEEIKEYVIREQKASTSLIQRRFSIGYNRAARIIDELEEAGVIGPQNGAKPREVYFKNQELY